MTMRKTKTKHMLLLKTVDANGKAYGGFQWPLTIGATVTAADWQTTPQCGYGLHGLPWGEGDGSLLNWDDSSKWLVWSTPESDVICFDRKAKAKIATIRYVGDRGGAAQYLAKHGKPGASIVGGTATAGYGGNIVITYYDGKRDRIVVGAIGEDGLLPNVAYRFDASVKKFMEVKKNPKSSAGLLE